MIFVDSRTGSGELIGLFPKNLDATISTLEYGDFMFLGYGPDRSLLTIGIERKTIKDLVNSMITGRLSGHQLPGLLQQYYQSYIIVEGIWRFNPESGILEARRQDWEEITVGQRRFMAKEIVGFLNTIAVKTGVIVMYSRGKRETVQLVCSLFHWWNDKQWNEHVSHLSPTKVHKGYEGEVNLLRPSILRRIAAELPLIGWGKSLAVEEYFDSVTEMVNAPKSEWRKIPGIGDKIANDVVEVIRKKKKQEPLTESK